MRRGAVAFVAVLGLVLPTSAAGATLHPGDILIAGQKGASPGKIVQVDPTTGAQTLVASTLNDPWGMAVTPDGRILVADFGGHAVFSLDPASGALTPITADPSISPLGIGLASDGRIIFSDYNAGKIVAIDPSTGARSTVASGGGLMRPSHLAITP